MNVFELRNKVLADYKEYVESFVNIKDDRIRDYVKNELDKGRLWPEALIQLNPSYEMGKSILQLADEGLLHPICKKIFQKNGNTFNLYDHQERAIRKALDNQHYILTTGTGSGKSLTYFLPIVDYILKNNPEKEKTRAIIIYPMNALINSQENEIKTLLKNLNEKDPMIKIGKYTGQEDDDIRKALQDHPPHILLTNYVMLELMMSRKNEWKFINKTLADIQFLVLDELHTYTGRQGADISMLIRRVRQRCGNTNVRCIGTSATMSSEGSRQEQREKVAEVGSKLFGVYIYPENVIDEKLKKSTTFSAIIDKKEFAKMIFDNKLPNTYDEFINHPFATWIEKTFGIEKPKNETFYCRKNPISLEEGAYKLLEDLIDVVDVDKEVCLSKIREMLYLGSVLTDEKGKPALALKLHQFISQGDSVYASIEPNKKRVLTLDGKRKVKGADNKPKLLYPLVFCRICGQEYYQVKLDIDKKFVYPKFPEDIILENEEEESFTEGYLLIDEDDNPIWKGNEEDLPENWFDNNGRLKAIYKNYNPQKYYISPNGTFSETKTTEINVPAWFIPTPFLTCLSCGEVYDKRGSEFRKLAKLSSEGRSTATTILSISTVATMENLLKNSKNDDNTLTKQDKSILKILSFTDNRQDASLQSGHYNDFIQVALLRSAIYKALEKYNVLKHDLIAQKVIEALNLPQNEYAKNPGNIAYQQRKNLTDFTDYIEYKIIEDLKRGWRINQPNLEQCGLLKIEYGEGLKEVCEENSYWENNLALKKLSKEEKFDVCYQFLNFLRESSAINYKNFMQSDGDALKRRINQSLKEPYNFEDDGNLIIATVFSSNPKEFKKEENSFAKSLSSVSVIGKYLKRIAEQKLNKTINNTEYNKLLSAILYALREAGCITIIKEDATTRGEKYFNIQLELSCVHWIKGDGKTIIPNKVRTRQMNIDSKLEQRSKINEYFLKLYKEKATQLAYLRSGEHTGQTTKERRKEREDLFREGKLTALFCSPTMELGIDISDLASVNLRNIPPTPTNYSQRCGRAGRSGQSAFISAYCSKSSGHDQYFFENKDKMVAGIVEPPKLDLKNEELVKSHINAIWLAKTEIDYYQSIGDMLNLYKNSYPLNEDISRCIELNETKIQECIKEGKTIINECWLEKDKPIWYNDKWIENVIRNAKTYFNNVFNPWRQLYKNAYTQFVEAQERQRAPHLDRKEEVILKQKEAEAQKQLKLLCNKVDFENADFYPYRYLASEGFLPGYNFPRLPIRAFIKKKDKDNSDDTFISRPRFQAIREFGPRNTIYNEGHRYIVDGNLIPFENIQFSEAKICKVCGTFYSDDISKDICENCGTTMNIETTEIIKNLIEMSNVRCIEENRITCDEEERIKEGYKITTHFKFSKGEDNELRKTHKIIYDKEQNPILELTFSPAATLWRINEKWNRSNKIGFSIDKNYSRWKKGGDEDNIMHGVRIFVRDIRNILLIKPHKLAEIDEIKLINLQYAIRKGLSFIYQINETELSSEIIGEGEHKSILYWEDTEGGIGVLERLIDEKNSIGKIAKKALEICHFNLDGTENLKNNDCEYACYRCLLTYYNQTDHDKLDRNTIKDVLVKLKDATPEESKTTNDATLQDNETYETIFQKCNTELERYFIEYLKENNLKLPDKYGFEIDNVSLNGFYYGNKKIVIICMDTSLDKVNLDNIKTKEILLMNKGIMVVKILYSKPLKEQIDEYIDIFTKGAKK